MKLKQGMRKRIKTGNYFTMTPTEEAKICLNCTEKRCKGDCEKIRKIHREVNNGEDISS